MNSGDTKPEQSDIWYVRVPKSVGKVWLNSPSGANLGKIQRAADGSMKFLMDSKIENSCVPPLPHETKLVLNPIEDQNMFIFTQVKEAQTASNGSSDAGEVIQTSFDSVKVRGQLVISSDKSYMHSKSSLIRQAAKPVRVTQILDKAVAANNPRSAHQLAFEAEQRKKKDECNRLMKEDKDIVTNRLYNAFTKQQYYNFKDLQKLTNQPAPYLKEILKEICIQSSKGTHKNMWELKHEYRHYKS